MFSQLILILSLLILYILMVKKMKMENEKNIYELEKQFRKNYSNIKLQNFFLTSKYPRKSNGLTFGFICPGAINTLKYLNTMVRNSKNDKVKGIVSKDKITNRFPIFHRNHSNLQSIFS